jgi:hypothetical protein
MISPRKPGPQKVEQTITAISSYSPPAAWSVGVFIESEWQSRVTTARGFGPED